MRHAPLCFGVALLAGALAASPLTTSPARAQTGAPGVPGTNSQGVLTGPVVQPTDGPKRNDSAPRGLPGARRTDGDRPIAFDRPPSEMDPNEALFDAINRGDINAARDAVNRGADLGATNVLGLTPTDLAVDLGRNDITFLLLAQRGADRNVFNTQAPEAAKPRGKTPVEKVAAHPAAKPAPAPKVPVQTATAQPAMPQYASTPGTPAPQAGFLGFGPSTNR